jgi:putative transposase
MEARLSIARCEIPKISLLKRCQLLSVNRSRLYYKKIRREEDEIWLMNLIRDIWLRYQFYGYRKITRELRVVYGKIINRKRVQRLMKVLGIEALYAKPKTSLKGKGHAIYPYLLTDLKIDHSNQVWMVDITYLRLGKGFVYLTALIDVYSRYVVGWHLSEALTTEGCLKALKSALRKAKPEIINSDQGCQFTSELWTFTLAKARIKISMDGKGRCIDNIYIERFWRSIKYEAIYLNEYDDMSELEKGIKQYIQFYNSKRYHQNLNYETPESVYLNNSCSDFYNRFYQPDVRLIEQRLS